jgi:hypothetical protein
MAAKVTKTEQYRDSQGEHLICRGKLVLISIEKDPKEIGITIFGVCYKPIIISEAEAIEDGDFGFDSLSREIIEVSGKALYFNERRTNDTDFWKILALPEHFSPEQLEDIVNGKLKDGDEVLVECENKYFEPDSSIHSNRGWEVLAVKLNQSNHITMLPKGEGVEESLSDRLFKLANDFAVAKEGDIAVMLHKIRNDYSGGRR